jgi:hypothetical protein
MREKLLDIIKHTSGLGFVEFVRVTGTDTTTTFEAMDEERTCIISATLKEPEPQLKGEFGMRNLSSLQGFLNHAPYRSDAATITVKSKNREGVDTPEDLEFKDEDGGKSSFRFMAANLLPTQVRLKNNSWNVDVTPSDSKIQEFASLASILSGVEQYFSVVTTKGNLEFRIGDPNGANHSASMTFAEGISGELKTTLFWPVNPVLTILKVGKNEKPSMQFMDLGALRIKLESEYANYEMILPARKK